MAKFINNTKTAQIARRAAAAGLSLPALAAALHKVSGREAADGANFGPSGEFYAHTGSVDEEAGDRYRQQFEQQGYLLFPGVRQQTAQAIGVPCDNSFHWAFDLVVGDFGQYHH